MAKDQRSSGNAADDFDDRDDDESVTVGDLREFGDRITTSIVGTISRQLEERDRLDAQRDRLAGVSADAEAALPKGDQLTALANRLGVSPETLVRAAAAAKAQEQADELRPYIAECIREELPAALDELVDDEDDDPPSKSKPRSQTRKPAASSRSTSSPTNGPPTPVGVGPTEPDTTPAEQHWAERRLWGK